MLDLFRSQEGEFLKYLLAANNEVSKLELGAAKDIVLAKLGNYLSKTDENFANMAATLKKFTDSEKSAYNARLSIYRERINKIKEKTLEEVRSVKGPDGNDSLENTLALIFSSKEIGTKILAQLHIQKSVIDGYDQQGKIEMYANEADKEVVLLALQKIRLKTSMVFVVFLEVVILFLVLYIKIV